MTLRSQAKKRKSKPEGGSTAQQILMKFFIHIVIGTDKGTGLFLRKGIIHFSFMRIKSRAQLVINSWKHAF